MKNRKWFIVSEIFFAVLYIGSYLVLYMSGMFEKKSNVAAICLIAFYTLSAMVSLTKDFTAEQKIRPTVRTIGLYVLGIVYFLSFLE